MNRYLSRFFLIGCVQIVLSTGVALASNHEIVEIIRGKVEQITSGEELQIESARIASVTVLPELYEKNGFQRLWTNPQNVEDLFNAIKTIEELRPQHIVYGRYKSALKKYRAYQADGGWEPVPTGPTLKKGMQDDRVLLLRKRLKITGDLTPESPDSGIFDDPLEQAVKQFQARHHLAADGVVGQQTLETLNVPVEARIDQIRINLERLRWVLHAISGKFVIADIAGFEVFVYKDNETIWTSRVQVGRPYRQTPVLKASITYLELNPTWTVPPGILAKDILPAAKKDPNYLKDRNIRVIDRTGKVISQDTIDWSKYSGRNFPYQLRQDPGPDNAMGLIKIMFPNKHLVFIHDTPSRSLFERTDRTFSSGCIRTEKPFELAKILLDNPAEWNQESFKRIIDSGRTQRVTLPKPVPVLLFYWTAAARPDGSVRFKKDPYKRDAEVLEGLNGEFRFRKRPVGQKRQTL
ncbi:MAG: L,D-transpeptidase family protein [Desulfobacterales bacterium]|jgi:murein L,D-transpeptidase YcbB/YkuD